MANRKKLTVPRVIDVIRYDKTRSYVHVVAELQNIPGALEGLVASVSKLGLNITNGHFSVDDGRGYVSLFAEAKDLGFDVEGALSSVSSVASVVSAEVEGSRNGLIMDTASHPMVFSTGQRSMAVGRGMMARMLKSVREVFASGGDALVYMEGTAAGLRTAKELVGLIGKDVIVSRLAEFAQVYTALGWGISSLDVESLTPLRAHMTVRDSFECEGEKSGMPSSHFIRGHIAGLAEALFGVPISCTEINCQSSGDGYCRFLIEPRQV